MVLSAMTMARATDTYRLFLKQNLDPLRAGCSRSWCKAVGAMRPIVSAMSEQISLPGSRHVLANGQKYRPVHTSCRLASIRVGTTSRDSSTMFKGWGIRFASSFQARLIHRAALTDGYTTVRSIGPGRRPGLISLLSEMTGTTLLHNLSL